MLQSRATALPPALLKRKNPGEEKRSKGQPEQAKKSKAEEQTERSWQSVLSCAGDATGTGLSPCFNTRPRTASEATFWTSALPPQAHPQAICRPGHREASHTGLRPARTGRPPRRRSGSSPVAARRQRQALVGECCTVWEPPLRLSLREKRN